MIRGLPSLCLIALGLAAAPAGAAVVFTDSFESPDNGSQPAPNNWRVYQVFGDWTTTAGSGIEIQNSGVVVTAKDGDQYVELDSDESRGGTGCPCNSAMTRFVNLVAGTYELSWWYLPRTATPGDNTINVFVDGASDVLLTNLVATSDGVRPPTNDWVLQSVQFTVDGTDNLYGVSFAAAGIDNTLGGFIDLVTLVSVPAPAPLALLCAGLLGLGLGARRNR